ncbi:hypothetical protein [Pedobacter immunditicola]|uniref:hypothetical protein n=1 Tax=Pedobacter immunditicola TaxID=3133440 RepID=UPI0030958836
MNIKLKDIKYYESFSEKTQAFTVNLYIEGKPAGIAKSDSPGGVTYHLGDSRRDRNSHSRHRHIPRPCLINYPKDEYMEAFSILINLEHYIDDLLNDYLRKKTWRKSKEGN